MVKIHDGSIFEGEIVEEVTKGMEIEIESTDRIRSRRGPNQEYNRADDMEGSPIYRWIRVTALDSNPLPEGVYIRDDTFIPQIPLPPSPVSKAPGRRRRRGEMPEQTVLLVGSVHTNHTSYWHDSMARFIQGSDIVVEYPLGSHPSPGDKGIPPIMDKTQNDIIKAAASCGARVIGADSRKRVTHKGVEAMSLRHISKGAKIKEIPLDTIPVHFMNLASRWISCCLDLSPDKVPGSIADEIAALVDYHEAKLEGSHLPPDMPAICLGIFHRVRTFAKYFKPSVKVATKEVIESGLAKDLEKAKSEYQESSQALTSQIKEAEQQIADMKKQLEVKSDDRELIEKYNDTQSYYENLIKYPESLLLHYREEAVSVFYDALCNLTLFIEVLARNRSNLVVAFGKTHVNLLHSLLKKIDKQHKNYTLVTPTNP